MKIIPLAAVAVLFSVRSAHAQWIVLDPTLNSTALASFAKEALTEIHEAQSVVNTAQTVVNTATIVNSVLHGNIMGLARLAPLLGTQEQTNPMGSAAVPGQPDPIALMMSGAQDAQNLGNNVLRLYGTSKQLAQSYKSPHNDYASQSMAQRARAVAGALAASTQYFNTGASRLGTLPLLNGAAEVTGDLKSSVDAGNTLHGQQIIQGAQTNQLLAMQIYQRAEEDRQRGLDEQEWRRSTDSLSAGARVAAAYAAEGHVGWIAPGQ